MTIRFWYRQNWVMPFLLFGFCFLASNLFISIAMLTISFLSAFVIISKILSTHRSRKDYLLYLSTSIYFLVLSLISWDQAATRIIWFAEAKLMLFPLLFIMAGILKSYSFGVIPVFVVSVPLILVNTLAFVETNGAFRYLDSSELVATLSIYMAIILGTVIPFEKNWLRAVILLLFLIWLGSSTGLVALYTSLMAKWWKGTRVSSKLVAIAAMPILIVLFYQYNLLYRSRNIFDLETIDRFQLVEAGIKYAYTYMGLNQVLFGFGVGEVLSEAAKFFNDFSTVLPWLLSSRALDGFTGLIYHNEYLRIYFNFGLIGLSLTIWCCVVFFRSSPILLLVLGTCSIIGSTVYISIIISVFILLDYFKVVQNSSIKVTSKPPVLANPLEN